MRWIEFGKLFRKVRERKYEVKPLISVVMAVYNGARYLPAQMESILCQNYDQLELIVVDDASTDESVFILKKYASKDNRIKIYQNAKNVGIVNNFLNALCYSSGELICFADQDDVWRLDKLEILSSLLSRDPAAMLAYSDLEVCDEHLQRIHPSFWKISGIRPRSGRLREFALFRNIMPGCSMMFRREIKNLVLEVLPQSSFIHDHLTFVLASSRGNVVYSPEPLVKYRQHLGNNIGAFYPSVADSSRFCEQLNREVALLKPLLPMDVTCLEHFLSADAKKHFISRLRFLRFYLWLRRDSFFSKCLGFFECLVPELYHLCKRGFHARHAV